MNSAQDASSQVPAVAEAVLDELDVFQVILDDADEVAQALLLLLQVLRAKTCRAGRRAGQPGQTNQQVTMRSKDASLV